MICNFYGKKYSANYIGELCFATTEGVSLSAISYAADKLGLSSRIPKLGAIAWG
jgi:ABC transporter, ATP-binding protein